MTYLNELLRDGSDLDEAPVQGACSRVRPVLMTATTTALGLFPLVFSSGTGSEVQRPVKGILRRQILIVPQEERVIREKGSSHET